MKPSCGLKYLFLVCVLFITPYAKSETPNQSNSVGVAKSQDMAQIYQLLLDLKELDPYFQKTELPKHPPLLVLKNQQISDNMHLTKYGKQIRLVSHNEVKSQSKPYIEFFNLDINQRKASVMFIYPVENVDGAVSFSKSEGLWQVTNVDVTEF